MEASFSGRLGLYFQRLLFKDREWLNLNNPLS